ncbi:MAG TPA: hypothetical protein VER58_20755 [Thermoanaerobaculia bacterium]|nr:hypothetical protein [Thermoanaerobaculia bacterium]
MIRVTMTSTGKHIVDDFEALPDAEKPEVLARILTISKDIDYPQTGDEELVTAADHVFLEYDHRETTK